MASGDTDGRNDSGPDSDASRRADANPFQRLIEDVKALVAYLLHYLTARADLVALRARRIALWTALGLAVFASGLTALVVAVALVLRGTAGAMAALLGGRSWAGELIVGAGVLILMAIVAGAGASAWIGISAAKTREKYERRRQSQRSAFGEDVSQRAARHEC